MRYSWLTSDSCDGPTDLGRDSPPRHPPGRLFCRSGGSARRRSHRRPPWSGPHAEVAFLVRQGRAPRGHRADTRSANSLHFEQDHGLAWDAVDRLLGRHDAGLDAVTDRKPGDGGAGHGKLPAVTVSYTHLTLPT